MSAAASAISPPAGWEVSTSTALKWVYSQFNADSHAGGSNNSPRLGGVLSVLSAMNLTADSVLLDLGSGFGIPSFAAALTYGCKCIGVEYQPHLVKRSNELCAALKLAGRCRFVESDIMKLDEEWLAENKVTHVYSFDTAFTVDVWEHMNEFVSSYGESLRALASNYQYAYWLIEALPTVTQQQISMCVSGERRTFYVMTPEKQKRSPKRKADSEADSSSDSDVKPPSVTVVRSDDDSSPKKRCNPFYYTSLFADRVSYKTGLPLKIAAKDLGSEQFSRLNGVKCLNAQFRGALVTADSGTGVELHHAGKWWSFGGGFPIPAKFVGNSVLGAVFDDTEGWIRAGLRLSGGILWNEDQKVYDPFSSFGQNKCVIE